MNTTEQEIVQILDMIPFFPDKEKHDFVYQAIPKMTEKKKKSVLAELWRTFRELIAQVPITTFMESSIPEDLKNKILQIEKTYLVEIQEIEKTLTAEFRAAEQTIMKNDLQSAENLLHQL